MAEAARLLGRRGGQHVDQVPGPEPLLGPQHRRQRHPHLGRRVERLGRGRAEVAVAAGLRRLAEVAQQRHPTAGLRLGEPEERVEPPVVRGLHLGRGQPLVDLGAAVADVVGAEERERVGGRAVAAGAADLLVVGLDRLREVGMGDPADVGLVDAHAEGDRGHDDQPVLLLEAPLDLAARIGLHAGVVMAGGVAVVAERARDALGLGAGAAVDDAGLPTPRGGEGQDLAPRLVLRLEGQRDVGAVEAVEEHLGLVLEEPRRDLRARLRVCRRGEGRERHAQRAPQRADPQVVRAEVVAPLAHAMRLVHRDERAVRAPEHPFRAGGGEALGGDVEQLQQTRIDRLPDLRGLLLGVPRGERAGADPGGGQRADLVAHERDEGRDDDRQPVAH